MLLRHGVDFESRVFMWGWVIWVRGTDGQLSGVRGLPFQKRGLRRTNRGNGSGVSWGQVTLLDAKENAGKRNLGRGYENPLQWVVAPQK